MMAAEELGMPLDKIRPFRSAIPTSSATTSSPAAAASTFATGMAT